MNLRSLVAATLSVALLASCASGLDAGSDSGSATDPTGTVTPSPDTVAVPQTELPPVPAPLALPDDPIAAAVAIVDVLLDDTAQRDAAVLAAYSGAHLPVLLADGTSLTTTSDPVGFPWAIVSSATTISSPRTRVSLAELAGLFALVDPTSPFDAEMAADELVTGLRSALTATDTPAQTFLAQLVAEEARRFREVELADPATTAEQVFVDSTVAMMITAAGFRAVVETMTERGIPLGPEPSAGTDGPPRSNHSASRSSASRSSASRSSASRSSGFGDTSGGCDDGYGGWLLWLQAKFATGANLPGFGWKGMYTTLAELGVSRGRVSSSAVEASKTFGKGAAVAGGLLNVGLLYAQVSTRHGTAAMDGTGPLIRTKTTSHGSARTITLTIGYVGGNPKVEDARNCILASLAAFGNSTQLAVGPAAGVEVDTVGELGFTKNLVTTGTLVLFGPNTFHPTQTADDQGRITIPVQGRRQKYDKSDATKTVDKQFSLSFEASLDPVTASTLGRALSDTALCFGTAASGDVVDGVAECQNAVVDIVKQFHWDLGEFFFPLTDWDNDGYSVNDTVFPYTISGFKCGGVGGTWDLYMFSASPEFAFDGIMLAEIDGTTLTGPFTFEGEASAGGRSIPVTGSGTATFVLNADGTAWLEISGAAFGPRGAGGSTTAPFSIPVTRNEECDR